MMTSSQKVFEVLEFLCKNGPSKSSVISSSLNLQKSSVHRFLNSLIAFGYVRKNELTSLFAPTLKVVQLGFMVSTHINILDDLSPYLRKFVEEFNLTAGIGTFFEKQLLILKREYPKNLFTHINLNHILPAYCTGMGKALLSTLSDEEIDEYIATVKRTPFTEKTLIDSNALKENIILSRQRGFATDEGEINLSLSCVAVPVISTKKNSWAISVSGPSELISHLGAPAIAAHLQRIAQAVASPLDV